MSMQIGVSGRDSGGLGGIIASRRLSAGTRGAIDGSKRDSTGLRGVIEGFGPVGALVGCGTHLLACILGSNSCNTFLFLNLTVLARQVSQVAKTLLPSLEASLRNEERALLETRRAIFRIHFRCKGRGITRLGKLKLGGQAHGPQHHVTLVF